MTSSFFFLLRVAVVVVALSFLLFFVVPIETRLSVCSDDFEQHANARYHTLFICIEKQLNRFVCLSCFTVGIAFFYMLTIFFHFVLVWNAIPFFSPSPFYCVWCVVVVHILRCSERALISVDCSNFHCVLAACNIVFTFGSCTRFHAVFFSFSSHFNLIHTSYHFTFWINKTFYSSSFVPANIRSEWIWISFRGEIVCKIHIEWHCIFFFKNFEMRSASRIALDVCVYVLQRHKSTPTIIGQVEWHRLNRTNTL